MKKEFGKWLMDIAKYITTAVILSSIFSDIQESWILYVSGILTASIALIWGLYLVKERPIKNKKRRK